MVSARGGRHGDHPRVRGGGPVRRVPQTRAEIADAPHPQIEHLLDELNRP